MKKRALLIVMTLLMAMVVAACGSSNNAATSGNNGGNSDKAGAAAGSSTAEPAASQAAEPAEITVTHKLGETKVGVKPAKVVVFDFGTLDSLDKLGVEVLGVPKSNLPSYLSKYEDAKYEDVGGLMEPDFEKINSLQPDLIIISGRQQDAYEEFSKIGPTIFMGVDNAKYMDSFTENVTLLGRIFGKETEAKAELDAIGKSIEDLKAKASASGKKALVILANEGKISAYGPGSRFGILHDVFGFAASDDSIEVSTHGQSVSFEYVAEKNPDYLFVVDRGAVVAAENGESKPAKETVENDLVKNTNAFKNGKIVYLDPNYWYLSGGGLVSVAEMIKETQTVLE